MNKLLLIYLLWGMFFNVTGQQLLSAEYFWDTDPGIGNGIQLNAIDGSFDSSYEQAIASTSQIPLTNGLHVFNVRMRDNSGFWGDVFQKVVYIASNISQSDPRGILEAEYFWDNDPGFGNATGMLSADGNFNEALEELITLDLANIAVGLHRFSIRIKDDSNNWSDTFSKVVLITSNNPLADPRGILEAEYFWDTDPGVGNALSLISADGNFDQALEMMISNDVVNLSSGHHLFSVRIKDDSNNWSDTFSKVVLITSNNPLADPRGILEAEYFWDTDPGVGNALSLISADGNFDQALEMMISNDVVNLSSGHHLFSVRIKDDSNNWSDTFSKVVYIGELNSSAVINETICNGDVYMAPSGTFTTNSSGTYFDTLVNSLGFDSLLTINLMVLPPNSISITVSSCDLYVSPAGNIYTQSGIYSDTLTATNGCDSIVEINLVVTDIGATITQNGMTLTANPSGAGFSYQWIDCGNNNQPISGETGASFIATQNGTFGVVVSDGQCSDSTACATINNLGIWEDQADNTIKIAPNPASEVVLINTKKTIESISCFTIGGRNVSYLISLKNKTLDISNLKSGAYILVIESLDTRYKKRLIVI